MQTNMHIKNGKHLHAKPATPILACIIMPTFIVVGHWNVTPTMLWVVDADSMHCLLG